jgi:hypothetical protein
MQNYTVETMQLKVWQFGEKWNGNFTRSTTIDTIMSLEYKNYCAPTSKNNCSVQRGLRRIG